MTELVIRSTNVPASFTEQMEMARVFASSSLLPAHLRGKPENILVILDGARALDVPSFWAFQSMYVVEGKLSLSAELMRALVTRAGHKFRVMEHTAQNAKVAICRKDDPDFWFESEFTFDEAKQAGLTNKGPWKNYPKAMLLARATSQAVRAVCSDVLFGVVYTPEELGASVREDGEPVIDNTGKVVLDSTSSAGPVVDQQMVDKCYEVVASGSLLDAANAMVMARRLKADGMIPNGSEDTLLVEWVKRIQEELFGKQCTEEDLRALWKYAQGTDVLNHALPDPRLGEETNVSTEILKQREKLSNKQPEPGTPFEATIVEDAEIIGEVRDAEGVNPPVDQ